MDDVLNEHVADIVESLKLAMPALATCKTHTGRFGIAELQRLSTALPAILVSVLRYRYTGKSVATWEIGVAIYVLTRTTAALPRERAALSIVGYLSSWLSGRRFRHGQAVVDIDAQNLYATELEGVGITLWGVSFFSPITNTALPRSHGVNALVDVLQPALYGGV